MEQLKSVLTSRPLLAYERTARTWVYLWRKAGMNPFFHRHTGLTTAIDQLARLIEQREENASIW
jgi:hypothetical protein